MRFGTRTALACRRRGCARELQTSVPRHRRPLPRRQHARRLRGTRGSGAPRRGRRRVGAVGPAVPGPARRAGGGRFARHQAARRSRIAAAVRGDRMLIDELCAELQDTASCAEEAQRQGWDLPGLPEDLRRIAGEAQAISATRTGSENEAALQNSLRILRRLRGALQLSGLMREISDLIDRGRSCGLRSKCRTAQQAWRDFQALVSLFGSVRPRPQDAERYAAINRMLALGIAGRPPHELRSELVRWWWRRRTRLRHRRVAREQ